MLSRAQATMAAASTTRSVRPSLSPHAGRDTQALSLRQPSLPAPPSQTTPSQISDVSFQIRVTVCFRFNCQGILQVDLRRGIHEGPPRTATGRLKRSR